MNWLEVGFLRAAIAASAMALLAAPPPARAACEFPAVKQQIDTVLDRDAARGAKFRSEVASGADPIAMLEDLIAPEMREQLDICRFDVAEYLTKRGFPPFH